MCIPAIWACFASRTAEYPAVMSALPYSLPPCGVVLVGTNNKPLRNSQARMQSARSAQPGSDRCISEMVITRTAPRRNTHPPSPPVVLRAWPTPCSRKAFPFAARPDNAPARRLRPTLLRGTECDALNVARLAEQGCREYAVPEARDFAQMCNRGRRTRGALQIWRGCCSSKYRSTQ